jgi:hypothetical protein
MRRLLATPLSVLVLALACSSESDTENNVSIEDAPRVLSRAACAALESCFGSSYTLFLGGEDCETSVRDQFEEALDSAASAIEAGKLQYSERRLQACADSVRRAGCDFELAFESPTCLGALDGTVELGGDCSSTQECRGAAFCKSAGTCPGTCMARSGLASVCEDSSECERGLDCTRERRCRPPAALGAACGGDGEPDNCKGGLCIGADAEADVSGECQRASEVFSATAGEPCLLNGTLCADGLVCTITAGGAAPETACAARVASGAACRVAIPDQCPAEEYCAVAAGQLEGTCIQRPRVSEACAPGPFADSDPVCAPFTRCENGTCRARQRLGGSCQSDDVCLSETCLRGKCALEGACE